MLILRTFGWGIVWTLLLFEAPARADEPTGSSGARLRGGIDLGLVMGAAPGNQTALGGGPSLEGRLGVQCSRWLALAYQASITYVALGQPRAEEEQGPSGTFGDVAQGALAMFTIGDRVEVSAGPLAHAIIPAIHRYAFFDTPHFGVGAEVGVAVLFPLRRTADRRVGVRLGLDARPTYVVIERDMQRSIVEAALTAGLEWY
jgi:hypothetical protein